MKSAFFQVLLACIALVAANLVPVQVSAHHSFAAEFDINQPFEVTGAVTSIDWRAPFRPDPHVISRWNPLRSRRLPNHPKF